MSTPSKLANLRKQGSWLVVTHRALAVNASIVKRETLLHNRNASILVQKIDRRRSEWIEKTLVVLFATICKTSSRPLLLIFSPSSRVRKKEKEEHETSLESLRRG